MNKYLKTLFVLALITIALPLNFSVVLFCIVRKQLIQLLGQRNKLPNLDNRKKVLISGGKMTKSLHLARAFQKTNHKVILVESRSYWLSGHRYSNAVEKFFTLPDSNTLEYKTSLLKLIQDEKIDIYIPVNSPASSIHDSNLMPELSLYCEIFHVEPSTILKLDNKFRFFQESQKNNLSVPKSFLITDHNQVLKFDFSGERREYILKSIAYDPLRRLELTRLPGHSIDNMTAFVRSLPISEANPWILQEFIIGQEFCTHGVFRNGQLRVHCCCQSSAFQVNYDHINHPEIESWVRQFGLATNLTGQASFDFIQADDDGMIYAIECNPRTHSAITLFTQTKELAEAYLEKTTSVSTLVPSNDSKPTYWLYHEIWRILSNLNKPRYISERLKIIIYGRDAIFDLDDPLPFLMLHHWQIPLLLLKNLRNGNKWTKIDFNIGKLVQEGGD